MKHELSVDVIRRWMDDSDSNVRWEAMLLCKGRADIPIDLIQKGMRDSEFVVRAAAIRACESRTDIPLIRTFEPPERVYKKCLGDVIVVAEIPKDAQVRGSYKEKCRANKAKIVDILGTFGSEKVGISMYDRKATYIVGDDIEIEDFDLSNDRCSTGFHFFCTLEQAKEYEM